MVSLHVICGLAPLIKNPGYVYDRSSRKNDAFVFSGTQLTFLKQNVFRL